MKTKNIILTGVVSLTILLTGCSSTNNLEETINNPTDNIAENQNLEINKIDEKEEERIALQKEAEAFEVVYNEKLYLLEKLEIINRFISENSTKISQYLVNGDMQSARSYSYGLAYDQSRSSLDKKIANMKNEVVNSEAKILAEEVSNLYFQFMEIAELTANGDIGENLNSKTVKLVDDIEAITNKVMDYN